MNSNHFKPHGEYMVQIVFYSLAFMGLVCAQDFERRPPGEGEPPPWMQTESGSQGQRPPMGMMMGGGTAIAVDNGFVLVVFQGQLMKYESKALKLQSSVSLVQPGEEQARGGGNRGTGPGREEGAPGRGETQGRNSSQRGPGQGGTMGRMSGGSSVALTVADGVVYVLFQGKLSKFNAKNLELLASAELERKPVSGRAQPKKSPDSRE